MHILYSTQFLRMRFSSLFVVGWFPLLVSSLKICEVLITSPATFPWLSYASRNKSGHLYALEGGRLFDFNFVDAAHSPALNHIWVQYEPYKNILLQNLDFVVCNYALLCSTLLLWSNIVFVYEAAFSHSSVWESHATIHNGKSYFLEN